MLCHESMHMWFFWDFKLNDFFFKNLNIKSPKGMAIACLVMGLFSVLYEGIKVYNAYARAKVAREQIAAISCAPSESANLLVTENNTNAFSKRFVRLINETLVFLFHNTLGYVVMLAVMVYNGWLFLAVILSMGLGYFFFGHIAIKINMESIQARTTKVVCTPSCSQVCAEAAVSRTTRPNASASAAQMNNSTRACHENQTMCETKPIQDDCLDKNASVENVDEDCCCRL